MYSGIVALLEQYLIDRFLSNASPVSHTSKVWLGLMVLASFFLILGSIYLIYAFNLWLLEVYTPQGAAMMTGALCFGIAILVILTAWLVLQYKRSRVTHVQDDMRDSVTDTIAVLLQLFEDELREPIERHPKAAIAIASLAGLLAGKRFL